MIRTRECVQTASLAEGWFLGFLNSPQPEAGLDSEPRTGTRGLD